MDWVDSPDYLEELAQFLAPTQNTVFSEGLWWAYTDVTRFQGFLDLLRRHTAVEGKRILDSGCGAAGMLIALQRCGAGELVGVELEPRIYRLAILRTHRMPGIRIVKDDALLLNLEPESFDVVTSLHVIEHVADYRSYIRAQARLLKPGGVMLIACPNRLWPFEAHSKLPLIHYLPRRVAKAMGRSVERAKFLPRSLRDRGRTATLYETDFTYFSLRRLLRSSGFQILEMNDRRVPMSDLLTLNSGWAVRALQFVRHQTRSYVSVLGSISLNVVCRKAAPGQVHL